MSTVEETRLKETPERAQSWLAEELVTSHETLKKVRQQMSDYLELSRSEFIMLVDQCAHRSMRVSLRPLCPSGD